MIYFLKWNQNGTSTPAHLGLTKKPRTLNLGGLISAVGSSCLKTAKSTS